MDEDILDNNNNLQPQQLKGLRVLLNFKTVNGKSIEDPRNFPKAKVLTVIRKGRGSEAAIEMINEAVRTFGPIAALVEKERFLKNLIGRSPYLLHPSLYRALKLTFPRDIGSLATGDGIPNAMATESMSQAVGVLTPTMFRPCS